MVLPVLQSHNIMLSMLANKCYNISLFSVVITCENISNSKRCTCYYRDKITKCKIFRTMIHISNMATHMNRRRFSLCCSLPNFCFLNWSKAANVALRCVELWEYFFPNRDCDLNKQIFCKKCLCHLTSVLSPVTISKEDLSVAD